MGRARSPVDGTIAADAVDAVATSIERILAAAGRRAPARRFTSVGDFPAYWAEAAAAYASDDLPVRIAADLPVGSFGLTSYAIISSQTIEHAFRIFQRDAHHVVPGMRVELVRSGARAAELRIAGPDGLGPLNEMLLVLLGGRARQLVRETVRFLGATLCRPAPADPAPWETAFGVMPRFGAEIDKLVLPAALLGYRLRTASPAVQRALGPASSAETITDAVRAHIQASLRAGASAARIAKALGMSPRTLQRRLREAGAVFRDLVTQERIDAAIRLMTARPGIDVAAVADQVGFANTASFSRAFTRLRGLPPSRWRAEPEA